MKIQSDQKTAGGSLTRHICIYTRKGEERAFSLGNADGGDSVRASDVRSIARGIVCCSAGELASLASAP